MATIDTFKEKFVSRMMRMFFCAHNNKKWENLPDEFKEYEKEQEDVGACNNDENQHVNYYSLNSDKMVQKPEPPDSKDEKYIMSLRKHMEAGTALEKTKYKEYHEVSHTMGLIWTELQKFGDGTLLKKFKLVEKGHNYYDKLAGKMIGKTRSDKQNVMEEYLQHLFSKINDIEKNAPESIGLEHPKTSYQRYCFNASYNDYVNNNIIILYNNYIRFSKQVKKTFETKLKEDWSNYEGIPNSPQLVNGGAAKGDFNRLLYYVFEKDDLQYNKEIKDPDSTWKCGQRIMNTLFLDKFRVASWADKGNPIVLYDGDICKQGGCPGEVYISGKKETFYTITAGKFLDILIEAKNYRFKTSKQQLRVLIRINMDGQIDRDPENTKMNESLRNKLEEYKNAKGDGNKDNIEGVLVYKIAGKGRYEYENNETLLIKEKDIASYAITRKQITKDAKENNWKQNLDKMFKGWNKGSGFKSLVKTSDQKSREKKKKAADNEKKKQDQKKTAVKEAKKGGGEEGLFHNETILYAQPVERHYSPMERATYGMDKLELEDITFKF